MPLDAHGPVREPTIPSPEALHLGLNELARVRMMPSHDLFGWEAALEDELHWRRIEGAFLESERAQIAARAREAPSDAEGFVRWFESLRDSGPGQGDVLFPWLANEARLEQMKWFLAQEMAGEAGFDDLVALAQMRLPAAQAKLEMARNYWDEMGQGALSGMHGPMLERLARELELKVEPEHTVWEALALANVMVGLAANRRYAYHAIGALGAIELTAPGRSSLVNAGLKRLGVRGEARRYYALHATLDLKHSAAWNQEVLLPLVAADPSCAHALAEGALMRLRSGARCFDRYRAELWR